MSRYNASERIYCGIPDTGEIMAFEDWNEFVLALWADTSDEFRNGATDPHDFADGCLLSQNGVFVVTDRPDGRIDVENVG